MGASDKCTTGSTVRNDFRGGVRSGVAWVHFLGIGRRGRRLLGSHAARCGLLRDAAMAW